MEMRESKVTRRGGGFLTISQQNRHSTIAGAIAKSVKNYMKSRLMNTMKLSRNILLLND